MPNSDRVTAFVCPPGCRCECPNGPCEHVWDGWYQDPDGRYATATCTRCGMEQMSHDLRVMP